MGPKQSLLPNSTETPSSTRGWEALPRTVPRGASSQGPGQRVMGRWDLSGDDRAWGKAPGECACTGVTQDTPESDMISESREGHFRKDRLNMTLLEKEPCLTPFFSSSLTSGLPQATWVFRGLSSKLKTCCLMLRVNTSPSAWSQHGESRPWQRSWGKGLMGKVEIRPRGDPLLEHLSQNQTLSVLLYHAFHQLFWH